MSLCTNCSVELKLFKHDQPNGCGWAWSQVLIERIGPLLNAWDGLGDLAIGPKGWPDCNATILRVNTVTPQIGKANAKILELEERIQELIKAGMYPAPSSQPASTNVTYPDPTNADTPADEVKSTQIPSAPGNPEAANGRFNTQSAPADDDLTGTTTAGAKRRSK